MFIHEIYIQTSESTGQIFNGLLKTATEHTFDHLFASVAYATEKGCIHLIDQFNKKVNNWGDISKDWFISIDNGITEPNALMALSILPNSTVRIPNAEFLLAHHLHPQRNFHTKVYFFEARDSDYFGFFSGSANLSVSGLFLNEEQGTLSIWLPPIGDEERELLERVLEHKNLLSNAYAIAAPLDEQLLSQYQELRNKVRGREVAGEDENEIVRRITEPSPALEMPNADILSSTSFFWVKISYVVENLGFGQPGNQIDLPRGSRVFFGFGVGEVPRNTRLGTVLIRYGEDIRKCSMRYGNNQMDKLTLPIPGDSGPPTYKNMVLLFERAENSIYNLQVDTDQEMENYIRRSIIQGTYYKMRSGREFGVVSTH